MNKFDFHSVLCRLHYPYRILRNRILGKCEPVIVVLVLNNKCNLKCRYCFGQYSRRGDYKDFSTYELTDIINQLYGLGVRLLTVHGGEALLREDINEIVGYIKKRRMYVNFITNGLLLKEKISLIRGVDSLCISLDGKKEGHEMNRGRGTFKPTMEAIKLARREGFRLRVHATITKYTMNDVEFLAKLAKKIGFFQEFSSLYQCGGVNEYFRELMLTDEETKKTIREIIKWKKRGYPIYTAYRVLFNALHWPYTYTKSFLSDGEIPSHFKPIPCFYGKTKFIIDADGYTYPCFAVMDEFNALNVREAGVARAIQHVRDTTNRCTACVHFTNNDHNLLLSLSLRQLFNQCNLQLKELLGRY